METIDGRMPVLVGCGDLTDLDTPAEAGRSPKSNLPYTKASSSSALRPMRSRVSVANALPGRWLAVKLVLSVLPL